MMKIEKQLAKQIEDAKKLYEGDYTDLTESEYIAHCLLSQGVIVPPGPQAVNLIDTSYNMLDNWNDITGAVPKETSWYYELKSVIEDIACLCFGAGILYKKDHR